MIVYDERIRISLPKQMYLLYEYILHTLNRLHARFALRSMALNTQYQIRCFETCKFV